MKMVGIQKRHWIMRNLSVEGLYYHTCRYGESYSRPFWLSALIIGIATTYFWYKSIPDLSLFFEPSITIPAVIPALTRSLSTLFPFFELHGSEIEDYFFRIILLPILGILFIALRRNLERRFRH